MNWIRTEQRHPENGKYVIVSDGFSVTVALYKNNQFMTYGNMAFPKWWMAFPEPPVEFNIYDKETTIPNCTVQVLENSVTGAVSVGYWRGGKENAPET